MITAYLNYMHNVSAVLFHFLLYFTFYLLNIYSIIYVYDNKFQSVHLIGRVAFQCFKYESRSDEGEKVIFTRSTFNWNGQIIVR